MNDATKPWLGRRVVDAEHPLGDAGDHRRVQVLHAITEHELRSAPQLAVVAQHERVAEAAGVPAETALADIAVGDCLESGLTCVHAAGHGEVDAFQPDAGGEAQRRGVAGNEQAVAGHPWHHRQPGFGDQVRGVLVHLAALHQWCDR